MIHLRGLRPATVFTAALAGMILAGCASAPPPTAQLGAARTAITAAERSGAAERAPVELNNARDKLNRAEVAASQQNNQEALWLAEQAQVDAEVAGTRAQAANADHALQQIREGTSALGTEIQRPDMPR